MNWILAILRNEWWKLLFPVVALFGTVALGEWVAGISLVIWVFTLGINKLMK